MNKVKGFSLIEMVVALALGMLVTLAVVQLFMTNQSTFNVQRSSVEIMANGRLAMDVMAQAVRRAGYEAGSVVSAAPSFTAIPTVTTDVYDGSIITSDNYTSASSVNGVGSSDDLVLQYKPAQLPDVDCEGFGLTDPDERVTERYLLVQDTDGVPSLGCDGDDTDSTPTVLARGIENFQVLLGIDPVADDAKKVSQYLTPTAYAALSAPRPPIVSVRIGMLVRGEQSSPDTQARITDFYVLQTQIPANSLPADRRLRRVVIGTVEVRNADRLGV